MRLLLLLLCVATGCQDPTCGNADTDCVLAHLSVSVPMRSGPLRTFSPGTVQAGQLVAGKGSPALADPIGPPSLCFSPVDTMIGLPLTFTDPNGASPGGCFSVRPASQVRGEFGTATIAAFTSVADGMTSGRLSTLFDGSAYSDMDTDYVLDMYPVAAATAGKDVLGELAAGGPIVVGAPLSMPLRLQSSGTCYPGATGGGACPDGHPCSGTDHVCCFVDGGYQCLLPGLCR